MAVGQQDRLACADNLGLSCATPAAVVAREAANFSASACLSAYVLPGAGHATNLHRNAQRHMRSAMTGWTSTPSMVRSGTATAAGSVAIGCLIAVRSRAGARVSPVSPGRRRIYRLISRPCAMVHLLFAPDDASQGQRGRSTRVKRSSTALTALALLAASVTAALGASPASARPAPVG